MEVGPKKVGRVGGREGEGTGIGVINKIILKVKKKTIKIKRNKSRS